MSDPTIVIFDACVIYPERLRSLLMYLASSGLFKAKWSDEIHSEWIRNLLANRPDLSRNQLEKIREQMNLYSQDSLVTEYDYLIPQLFLPDPDDRHVLAAAIQGQAGHIVTFNTRDFPDDVLKVHDIIAMHPDRFIFEQFHTVPSLVLQAIKIHRNSYKRPPLLVEDYLAPLERSGLAQTVSLIRKYGDLV